MCDMERMKRAGNEIIGSQYKRACDSSKNNPDNLPEKKGSNSKSDKQVNLYEHSSSKEIELRY